MPEGQCAVWQRDDSRAGDTGGPSGSSGRPDAGQGAAPGTRSSPCGLAGGRHPPKLPGRGGPGRLELLREGLAVRWLVRLLPAETAPVPAAPPTHARGPVSST